MKIYENKNGLKGQQNLAQGKRSGALGLKGGMKIVRAITFIKAKIIFRTNEMTLFLRKMMSYNSVRKELYALFIEFSRTVFLLHPIPRAAFRIVPPETLPWAMIFWPFRPEEKFDINLCIKSSSEGEGRKQTVCESNHIHRENDVRICCLWSPDLGDLGG